MDADNEPLPGVEVAICRGGRIVRSTLTDETGQYVLATVPSGKYYVKVTLAGYEQALGELSLSDEKIVADFAMTRLPGTPVLE